MSRPRLLALLLAFITFAAFLPATRFAFINYDDNDYVTANPPVQAGLSWTGVTWAFTTWHADNWHPLTWISHMADCSLFGLNPGGHHLVNVLFHTANTVLLFALGLRLTGALWPAAFVAALFGWHPLHVESVAWIAERKDVLSTFFALLALLGYAHYVEASKVQSPKSKVFFAGSLLAFALGLLAKPMLVTLPFVLLLLDYWPLQRFSLPAFRLSLLFEKTPFFLLTALSCALTFSAQSRVVHGSSAVMSLGAVPLHYRLKNIPVAYAEYLLKLAWPAKLAVFYPLADRIPPARVAAAVAGLLLISAVVWRGWRTRPYLPVGWLWFLGTLVPVIGLVQVGGAALADRYSYLPSIGIFLAVAFAARDAARRFPSAIQYFTAAAVLILAGSLGAMDKQLACWQNSETLFRHALAVTTDNDVARTDLAIALQEQGRWPEALTNFQAAVRLAPERPIMHDNLGSILDRLGRHAEALAEYREALRRQPADATAHLGAGDELVALGKNDDALGEFTEAGRLDATLALAHAGIAKILFLRGRDAEAVEQFRAALNLEPDNLQILAAAAHYFAANENAAARDGRFALVLAAKANALAGGSQPVYFDVLGMALAETGDFTNAVTCAQNAIDLANAAQMENTGEIRQRLERYKNHQPWRESFRALDAPAKN